VSHRYVPVASAEYGAILAPHMSPAEVEFFLELFAYLLDGHNAHVTKGVEEALGRPARDFRDYARKAFAR
jgi:hypothetical protein